MTAPAVKPVDGTRSIQRSCGCYKGQRRPPIKVFTDTAIRLLALVATIMPRLRDRLLMTYRCPECKQVVDISVGDLLEG